MTQYGRPNLALAGLLVSKLADYIWEHWILFIDSVQQKLLILINILLKILKYEESGFFNDMLINL